VFYSLEVDLILIVPLALAKDLIQPQTTKARSKFVVCLCGCSCFLMFFLTFELFAEFLVAENWYSSDSTFANLKAIFFSHNSRLEFLTLVGIIFNAFMQGYVCSNSISFYLVLNWNFKEKEEGISQKEVEEKLSEGKKFHNDRIKVTID